MCRKEGGASKREGFMNKLHRRNGSLPFVFSLNVVKAPRGRQD